MLNTFSFEAWIMMNFEVEVWKIKHITLKKKMAKGWTESHPYLCWFMNQLALGYRDIIGQWNGWDRMGLKMKREGK